MMFAESRELIMPWGADEWVVDPMNRRWALTDKGRNHFAKLAAA